MLLVIRKTSEAAAMTHWGLRVAEAMGKSLHVLWAESGEGQPDMSQLAWQDGRGDHDAEGEWSVISEVLKQTNETPVQLCKNHCRSRHVAVLDLEKILAPSLIMVGRHDSTRDGSMTGKLARELLDEANSALLVCASAVLIRMRLSHPAFLCHARVGLIPA